MSPRRSEEPEILPVVPFLEAIEYFRSRVPMTKAEFEILAEEVRLRAFTIANVTSMQVLEDFHRVILKALREGMTYVQFQDEIRAIVNERGWIGPAPWHLDTIFRNNIQTAYGVGRLEQQHELRDLYPYGEYNSILDGRERRTHRDLHGRISPMDSAFWRIHYPPWEHRCRCACIPRTADEVKGKTIHTDRGPGSTVDFQGPGYGFNFGDPKSAVDQLLPNVRKKMRKQVVEKLEDPEAIRRSKDLFDVE